MRWQIALVLMAFFAAATPFVAADAPPAADAAPQAADAAFVPPGAMKAFVNRDGNDLMVGFESSMSPSDLVDFFRPLLEKAGWHFTDDMRDGRNRIYGLGKGEKDEGMLMLVPKHDVTTVVLNLKE